MMAEANKQTAVPEVAIILAAGLGSRLYPERNTPKPLTKVLGLTLAERVVCTLQAADVRRFLHIRNILTWSGFQWKGMPFGMIVFQRDRQDEGCEPGFGRRTREVINDHIRDSC